MEHRARITWSSAQVAIGLPEVQRTINPAWFEGDDPATSEGWSLECRFAPSPRAQGSPTVGVVRFVVPEAPSARLAPGARLRLFERATQQFAAVEILAS